MKKRITPLLICIFIAFFFIGCDSVKLDPKKPVTITMWHNYGGQMQSAMDELIDEFNSTIGRKKGVIISVTLFRLPKRSKKSSS